MPGTTCFVIMAIGDQDYGTTKVPASELKQKYDDLIKEAIIKARPDMEVFRADEIATPGTITTDIITRIMHSEYVVADVSYPNANVFYELGLRHACRPGTIIIREKDDRNKIPFDIGHLRYIPYENTASGLKELSEKLKQSFDVFEKDPQRPDNHFLEIAKLIKYQYPRYDEGEKESPEAELITALMRSPDVLEMIIKQQKGEEISETEVMRTILGNPALVTPMANALIKSGSFSLGTEKPNRETRRKMKKG